MEKKCGNEIFTSDFEPIKEGLFDLPEHDYRRIKALNITYAKLFNRSPAHVYTAINDPDAALISPSYAMKQGTAFHWAALQPQRFESEVVEDMPMSKNSSAYKAWKEDQGDKLILGAKDVKNVTRMVEVLKTKTAAQKYLQSGWPEKSIIWREERFGIWCKCLIDWIREDGQALIDLKKTQVASRWAFEMAIRRYEYYMQAAHYTRGYAKVMGYWPKEWVWIASEIDPPNECNVFVADPEQIEEAQGRLEGWYAEYQKCLETGEWPGYTDTPIFLGYNPNPMDPGEDDDQYPEF